MDAEEFLGKRKRNLDAIYFLEWFINNTIDNYLNQSESIVKKSIEKDAPPEELKKFLYDYENSHKKRKNVLKLLE